MNTDGRRCSAAVATARLRHDIPAAPRPHRAGPSPDSASASAQGRARSATVAAVVLVDVEPAATLWAWSRLVLQAQSLRGVPGLCFAKVLGSGFEGGFGLRPSRTRQGLYLTFTDEACARAFVETSPQLQAYRDRARELCVAVLRACSSKGRWAGSSMAVTAAAPVGGPVAALTRASIHPRHARAFWRLSPPAEVALADAPGCLLAAGLGEAPLLRQATFSLWTDADAMNAYARSGAHQAAIAAAYGGGFFTESMFVRYAPLQICGTWKGQTYAVGTSAGVATS
jgi:quinol monooxygenase YgiN